MQQQLIAASDAAAWMAALDAFPYIDVCHLPDYHCAYATRFEGAEAWLWAVSDGSNYFAYPFLKAPVVIAGDATGYSDIFGVYGYSGPLAKGDDAFIAQAWEAFTAWAKEEKILCEFIRFSPYLENYNLALLGVEVLENRQVAMCHVPASEEALLQALGPKTRNMLRKAEKAGLCAEEMKLPEGLAAFRALYDSTMQRNDATEFFLYDNTYYDLLLAMPKGAVRLFGVYADAQLVSTAMVLVWQENALYHLGASEGEYTKLGAGNLALFEMHKALMKAGVKFVNLTGGRTTALDDPLLRFKKSNGTGLCPFYIGKRVLDETGYAEVAKAWESAYNQPADKTKLQFYR